MARAADVDEFQVVGVSERVAPYDFSAANCDASDVPADELVEKAATLLRVMPPNQLRSAIEALLSPNDPERGHRAVDALIASAFVVEDDTGRLRRTSWS